MPPLSFPFSGEDSCSGSKSSLTTSCDASPSAPICKIAESLQRLWFFLAGRSTRARSFLVFPFTVHRRPRLKSAAYCRARRRASASHRGDVSDEEVTSRSRRSGGLAKPSTDCCRLIPITLTTPENVRHARRRCRTASGSCINPRN
jgi:hypothetical protein